jgi:hypothetical protein
MLFLSTRWCFIVSQGCVVGEVVIGVGLIWRLMAGLTKVDLVVCGVQGRHHNGRVGSNCLSYGYRARLLKIAYSVGVLVEIPDPRPWTGERDQKTHIHVLMRIVVVPWQHDDI